MNVRTLGTIAMICAPALFVEGLINPIEPHPLTAGIASFVFMFGWICTNLAMQQMQATGTGLWGKIVLQIQLVGLVLAMLFGFFEATQLLAEDNLLFVITDMCWPLSMLFMIVVGIMTIRANRWAGWQRFVPLICALWLPVAMGIGMGAESNPALGVASTLIGFGWTAVAWFVLALIVRSHATLVTPESKPVATAS
jgi:hypothetical protein